MIILRQKEFGFIQDVRRSGLGRTMKRNIGRFRADLVKRYGDDIILQDINKNREYISKLTTNPLNNNPSLEKNLIREANKNNARVIGYDTGGRGNSILGNTKGDLNEYSSDLASEIIGKNKEGISKYGAKNYLRYGRKIDNAISSGKSIIIHPSGSGSDLLAHELGHLKSQNGSLLSRGRLLDEASTKVQESGYGFLESGGLKDTTTGIIPGVKRYLKGRVILANERKASKNALDILKKNGATPEELSIAKKNLLGTALGTYKTVSDAYTRIPFKNLIQIPSRRGNKAILKNESK